MHRTAARRTMKKTFILGCLFLCWIWAVSSWGTLYTVGGSDRACPDYPVKAPERGYMLDQGRGCFVVVIFSLGASPIWLWLAQLPELLSTSTPSPSLPPLGKVFMSGRKNPEFLRTSWPYASHWGDQDCGYTLWTELSTHTAILCRAIVF